MASNYSSESLQQEQKQTKTSALRSFLHKRTPSAGATLATTSANDVFIASPPYNSDIPSNSYLPTDHPRSRALGELHQNQQYHAPSPSKKSREGKRPSTGDNDNKMYLHKKTLSSISLKSLAGRDTDRKSKDKEPKEPKPKKVKSSTNLGKLLSRPKSSKSLKKRAEEEEMRAQKNKENRSPDTSPTDPPSRPPIYAQFSSERFAKQPLGGKFLENEKDISGSDSSVASRRGGRPRPQSTYLPSSFSIQDISRRVSGESARLSAELQRRLSGSRRPAVDRNPSYDSKTSVKDGSTRSIRARTLVAGQSVATKAPEAKGQRSLRSEDVDREFEAMLDRRNIPEHQRGKMRSLDMTMKKDFVKQDWAELEAAKNARPGTNGSDSSADIIEEPKEEPAVKPKRPRSRAFTLTRSRSKEPPSPTKKQKPEESIGLGRHLRSKSTESLRDGNKSLKESGASVAQTLIAKAKGQLPEDFVSYLRKVQKPESVEVGRLHKLRLLLRNETVAWTDEFIKKGGMAEIVGLLHRTMEVEWREEHEDALLHETLLCLKALSTTKLALQKLGEIQVTLFPALLHLIFDEEKKGPAEFTTRNLISSLIFTYLKTAPILERTHRANVLLSYLKDPEPSESQRPVGFVLEMRQPRPYRVWCKEVSNVTKEVFWIFLHNLNVVALPGSRRGREDSPNQFDTSNSTINSIGSSISDFDPSNPHHIYMTKHFPQELPPVPAAPYVGGVEWDATNYLSSHLDIINGILASLPTKEDRNTLREQLRVSGWEKVMGNTLRTCKEKFYGCVHASLRCWVAAAAEDGWETRDVRCGMSTVDKRSPTRKQVKKGPLEAAPEIKMDFGREKQVVKEDAWL